MIKRIQAITNDPVVDLALDTLKLGKQCLIFVNTKRSAEHCAEVISTQIKDTNLKQLADKVISVLPQPTSQCRRLSRCVLRGVAFHHAGLHPRQKELVEENFRKGVLKIICCTTTMAAGVDLPAFRSIIRDLKRYGHRGMEFIPILEYHQAAGRAGRPGKEEYGESIAIARSEGDKEEIIEMFIKGKPERIYSKLAVEPVLRTYLLSLVATGIAKSQEELLAFFSKTFWAKQYEDMSGLSSIILKVLGLLKEWGFIEGHENGFVSAGDLGNSRLRTTPLGKRVAELYLDPLTAHHLVEGLRQARAANLTEFSWLQLICSTLEMRPLLRVRTREFDNYQEMLAEHNGELLTKEPSLFESGYEQFLDSVKTAAMLLDWIDERDEEYLMEVYGSRPGETRYKLEIGDWLLYSLKELAIILRLQGFNSSIERLRVRLKYGVKEELLPLLKLREIGRVRARKLYANNIKNIGDVKRASFGLLARILGSKIAEKVKKQVGQNSTYEEQLGVG